MKCIEKIKLINFKRFTSFEVNFDSQINILVGDNESGKSSILQAIDIVLSGNRNKVETFGLENLFNDYVISAFMQSNRNYEELPEMYIELYLNEQNNPDVCGRNNTTDRDYNGLKFTCKPNDELSLYIKDVLKDPNASFPFEFYSLDFKTFADQTYNNYNRFLKNIVIDSSQISSEYAMREYVKDIYNANVMGVEKMSVQHKYRQHKDKFKDEVLSFFNAKLLTYSFALKNTPKSNLESSLTIIENNVCIENRGKGRQCFIKTELALQRSPDNIDVVLIEEPENHLSHTSMQNLIHKIRSSNNKQLFIATHSNLISTRLNLQKTILLNSNSCIPLKLNDIPNDTADFFIKAPDNNILQFVLSKKVILVEGDAEYILMDAMYKKVINEELMESEIHILSVDGTSFKRYLDLAKVIGVKTAVITDNDKNYSKNIIQRYEGYHEIDIPNAKIFADTDTERHTFEICIYKDNERICEELFSPGRRTLSVQEYMLSNKSEASYCLAKDKANDIIVPQYIKDAIVWIKE